LFTVVNKQTYYNTLYIYTWALVLLMVVLLVLLLVVLVVLLLVVLVVLLLVVLVVLLLVLVVSLAYIHPPAQAGHTQGSSVRRGSIVRIEVSGLFLCIGFL
jgi:hypothetical protein